MNPALAIALSLLLCTSAQAANKCVGPGGKVEYMDAACPSDSQGTAVRTDRANSIDTSHGYHLDRTAGAAMECDAAKETLSHKNSAANRAAMRSACALPEPEPKKRQRTTCTGQEQAIGGGQSVTSSTCTTR